MAKTKTKSHSKSASKDVLHATDARIKSTKRSQKSIEDLLSEAAALLEQSQPELALPLAEEALQRLEIERKDAQNDIDTLLQEAAQGKATVPTLLVLEAEIYLGVGEAEKARERFKQAVQLDPDGALVSAEPLLWLAQLSEEGGRESIAYFEKGVEVIRNQIDVLQESTPDDDQEGQIILDERKSKLADALCGMAEVYMTDLSWEDDAETQSESFVTEAVAICPERLSAGVLQVLASVRISQERFEDAREALKRSMNIWKDIPEEVESESRPAFATRVSLSRLLMDVEAETEALHIIDGLVKEDDQSVECWYLGGWCRLLLSQKDGVQEALRISTQEQAMQWLDTCLRLYKAQAYEDDKLRDHAQELKQTLNKALGIEEDDEDGWEDDEEEMDDDDELELNGHHEEDEDTEMT